MALLIIIMSCQIRQIHQDYKGVLQLRANDQLNRVCNHNLSDMNATRYMLCMRIIY